MLPASNTFEPASNIILKIFFLNKNPELKIMPDK